MDHRAGANDANLFFAMLSGDKFAKDLPFAGDTTGDQKHPVIAWDGAKGIMHAVWESGTGKNLKIMVGRSEAGHEPEQVNRKRDGVVGSPSIAIGGVVCVFYEMAGATQDDGRGIAIRRIKR
jgi:hypothetical protein